MSSPAPPWLGDDPGRHDVGLYAAMTPEERLGWFVEVCLLADGILAERPDRDEVLARREPMPDFAERKWLALVAESRRG